MLKTVSRDEFKKLKDILKQYFTHLSDYPDSLMTRFYGLHKVEWFKRGTANVMKKYLVVMNNVFRGLDIGDRFDLKGSTVGRRTLREGSNKYHDPLRDKTEVLKDLDWMENVKVLNIIQNEDQKHKLEDILARDAQFFEETNIIDYSLLLGVVKNKEVVLEQIANDEIST